MQKDINKEVGFEQGDAFYPNVGRMRECRGGWWLQRVWLIRCEQGWEALSDSTHSNRAWGLLPAAPFSSGVLGEGEYPLEWQGGQLVDLL